MFLARLFRSRWAALIWAGGILWTAIDVAGVAPAKTAPGNSASAPTDATGAMVGNDDLAILANAMKSD